MTKSISLRRIVRLDDGTPVAIRPVRPSDQTGLVAFHQELSPRSLLGRYGSVRPLAARIAPKRLAHICESDQWDTIVLIACPLWQPHRVIAVGRLMVLDEGNQQPVSGETAMVVADPWQRSHLGRAMKEVLIQAAQRRGLTKLLAVIDRENRAALHRVRQRGYNLSELDDECLLATLQLSASAGSET